MIALCHGKIPGNVTMHREGGRSNTVFREDKDSGL